MIHLKKLFNEVNPIGIADDSRKVEEGFVFVAIKGEHVDGNDYIDNAIQNGAVAIVSEKDRPEALSESTRYQKVNNARKALAFLASEFYGNPSKKLKVIGVTGSDGKTTTSHLIYEVLKTVGKKVGLISSIEAKIGDSDLDTGFHVTNPEPLELHKFLSEMVKAGLEYVVLETTSHGLEQDRVYGINYEVAVLTNITHEHLDYHKTFENYRDTKLKLFLKAKTSVLNKDDESFEYIKNKITNKIITYSLKETADLVAREINIKDDQMKFKVIEDDNSFSYKTKLTGLYNVQNILGALGAVKALGISLSETLNGIANAPRPKGRLEKIDNDRGVDIYIDFAHTPNSLKEVLTLLKGLTKGKLIVVFGCASERDVAKRPIMGKIATEIADVSIFTAEDPRYEDINKILNEIEKGVKNTAIVEIERHSGGRRPIESDPIASLQDDNHYYIKIPERGEAITYAINKLAKKGDTVVICGKAHERSMAYNGVEYPWSDFEAVEMALKGKVLEIDR